MNKHLNYFTNATKKHRQRASDQTLDLPELKEAPTQIINVSDLAQAMKADIDPKIARTIFFDEEINEQSATTLRANLMSLAAENPDIPIRLMLGSPGGGLWESFAIYDTIKMLPCPTIAICSGKVMSGGILMLLACDYRVSTANTTFMIHHGHTTISGNILELEDQVKELKIINNRMIDVIIKETDIKREQLDLWLVKDHYVNAENAKRLGLIQDVVNSLDELDQFYDECEPEVIIEPTEERLEELKLK